jgi:hypothetical protein
MAKRKEPTETYYTVTLEKQVRKQAKVACRVTARLDRTKRRLIENSAEDLARGLPEEKWEELDEDFPEVVDVDDYDGYTETCPHCNKVIYGPEKAKDLGEVSD